MSLIFPDGSRTVPLGTAMPTRSPQPSTVGAGTETELPGMDGEWVRMPDGSYQPAGQPRRRPPRQRQVPTQASRPASGNNIGPGEGGVFTPIPSAGGMPPADPTRMTPLQLDRYHKAWMQDYERRMAEWKLQQMMEEAGSEGRIGKPKAEAAVQPDMRELIAEVRRQGATANQSVAADEQRPWKVENGQVVFMDTPEYERRTARRDSQRELQEDAAHERRMKSEAANRRNQKERALLAERRKNRGTFKNRPLEKEARREASARQERLRAERSKMPTPGDAQPIMPQEQGTPYGENGNDPRVLDYYFSLVASGESLGMAEAKAKQMARTLGVQFGQ